MNKPPAANSNFISGTGSTQPRQGPAAVLVLVGDDDLEERVRTAFKAADDGSSIDSVVSLRPDVVVIRVLLAGTDDETVAAFLANPHRGRGNQVTSGLLRTLQEISEASSRYVLTSVGTLLVRERGAVHAAPPGPPPATLSDRDLELLGLLGAGLTNRQIAERLNVATKTVQNRVGRLQNILGLPNRAMLMVYAISYGILQADHW